MWLALLLQMGPLTRMLATMTSSLFAGYGVCHMQEGGSHLVQYMSGVPCLLLHKPASL